MARLRGKPRQRINRNHTEVIQHPTYKIRRRKRLARGKLLCCGDPQEVRVKITEKAKIQNLAFLVLKDTSYLIWDLKAINVTEIFGHTRNGGIYNFGNDFYFQNEEFSL